MNFLNRFLMVEQSYPLELESFASKIKIVEEKLGVAMEENENERKIENKFDFPKEIIVEKGPMLTEASHLDDETQSFVRSSNYRECICSVLKKCYYWCTCECVYHCLRNFRICLKATLIVCMIAAGGYVLYLIWPFFQSIYAFFARCYDFLKGIVEWVVDLVLEIYQ
jgi:hypothetical protein